MQHHPSRAHLLPGLLELLGDATVVEDPEPDAHSSPWRCYRHALELCPSGADVALIVQDDARPCRDFPLAARRAIEACPDRVVCFFLGGAPRHTSERARAAAAARHSWAEVKLAGNNVFCPVVATAIPTRLIPGLLDYAETKATLREILSDDAIVGRYLEHAGEQAWATVPSLVDHPDDQVSLIGKPHMFGRNSARVAAVPIGDRDPLTIEW